MDIRKKKTDIRQYRQLYSLSQEAMGKKLGVAKTTISMVENRNRSLPPEALLIFESLLAEVPRTLQPPPADIPQHPNLQQVQELNASLGESGILERQKECELALHQYEMKMYQWKKRYEMAMTRLVLAENILAEVAGKKDHELPAGYRDRKQAERLKALNTIFQVGARKPLLVMVKMEGLRGELAAIKKLSGSAGSSDDIF